MLLVRIPWFPGKIFVVTPDSDLRTLLCLLLCHVLRMKLVVFIIHHNEFLTASVGREIPSLHLVTGNPSRHRKNKGMLVFLIVVLLTAVHCLSHMSTDAEHFLFMDSLATCTVIQYSDIVS